jgi:hypothetical protein
VRPGPQWKCNFGPSRKIGPFALHGLPAQRYRQRNAPHPAHYLPDYFPQATTILAESRPYFAEHINDNASPKINQSLGITLIIHNLFRIPQPLFQSKKVRVMRAIGFLALLASAMVWSIPTASALQWNCAVPEIDGPAGLSAIALLVSVGVMAYERCKG